MFINYLKYHLDIESTTAPKRIFACIKVYKNTENLFNSNTITEVRNKYTNVLLFLLI